MSSPMICLVSRELLYKYLIVGLYLKTQYAFDGIFLHFPSFSIQLYHNSSIRSKQGGTWPIPYQGGILLNDSGNQ